MAWTSALNQVISDNLVTGPVEESKLPFFATTQWEDVADSVDQVSIVVVGDAASQTYVPGTDLTIDAGAASAVVLKCDQLKAIAIYVDDTTKMVGQYAVAYANKARQVLALLADKYVLALATKANFATGWIAGAADATININNVNALDQLDAVNEKLNTMAVPDAGRFICVPPSIYTKIMKAAGVAAKTSDDFIFLGKAQKVRGLNILQSNQYTGTAPYLCLFGTAEAIAVANKPAVVEAPRDPKKFGVILKTLMRFGASVVNPGMGGVIKLTPVADA